MSDYFSIFSLRLFFCLLFCFPPSHFLSLSYSSRLFYLFIYILKWAVGTQSLLFHYTQHTSALPPLLCHMRHCSRDSESRYLHFRGLGWQFIMEKLLGAWELAGKTIKKWKLCIQNNQELRLSDKCSGKRNSFSRAVEESRDAARRVPQNFRFEQCWMSALARYHH